MEKSTPQNWPKPVIALAGFSGSGKTTLLCQLLEIMTQQGIAIAVIKHSHHQIELDKPGKDSYRLKQSGARQLLLSCPNQVIMFARQEAHDNLDEQLRKLDWQSIDMVIVEGYRHSHVAKLEIYRPEQGKPQLNEQDADIFAIASNDLHLESKIPVWPLDNPKEIAALLTSRFVINNAS